MNDDVFYELGNPYSVGVIPCGRIDIVSDSGGTSHYPIFSTSTDFGYSSDPSTDENYIPGVKAYNTPANEIEANLMYEIWKLKA